VKPRLNPSKLVLIPPAPPRQREHGRSAEAPVTYHGDSATLDIIEWLGGDECHDLDDAGLIAALARRLVAAGLPLDRLTLHLRTLHPEILGRQLAWAPDEPVEVYDREHGIEHSAAYVGSALQKVMERREWAELRLPPANGEPRSRLNLLQGRGIRHAILAPLVEGDGPASAVVFGTCRRHGFSEADRLRLERILPPLRSACELRTLREVETTLLNTYVGVATGRRILAGKVRRGEVESLEAALLLCDLRGFTALSERLAGQRVLELLNLYFDQVVPAITAGGGEILKFMGDAVLAFFRREDGGRGSCIAAYDAARMALHRLATVNLPDATLTAGVALHYGDVSYGNIGSGQRLDFTVIGRDVNLLSRIQTTCGTTGRPLLMSKRFASLLARPQTRSVGRHPLKGIAQAVELFA
jgi:adenylate cyclase